MLCPGGNETPPDQREIAAWLFRMLADDRDGLGRSRVVARAPVFLTRDAVEALLDDLLSARESVAATHAEIIADRPCRYASRTRLARPPLTTPDVSHRQASRLRIFSPTQSPYLFFFPPRAAPDLCPTTTFHYPTLDLSPPPTPTWAGTTFHFPQLKGENPKRRSVFLTCFVWAWYLRATEVRPLRDRLGVLACGKTTDIFGWFSARIVGFTSGRA